MILAGAILLGIGLLFTGLAGLRMTRFLAASEDEMIGQFAWYMLFVFVAVITGLPGLGLLTAGLVVRYF